MRFTFPFCYTPRPEIVAAARRLMARIDGDPALRSIFAEGKMLGVLMVEKPDGDPDFLYAFSGLAGGRNRIDGFVPPIYDLLDPEGHFKKEEAAIVALNREIRTLQTQFNDPSSLTENRWPVKPAMTTVSSPAPTVASSQAPTVASSQAPTGDLPATLQARIHALKQERRTRSIALQEWIFEQFEVSNALGQRLTIAEVFARRGLVPPSGTGECAAPKLLQYAYLHGLKPLALGEFWYGASPVGELRRHGSFYPACTGKCGPLLSFMLEGIDVDPDPLLGKVSSIPILYEDEAIIVIDKPSGILSAPGRANPVSVISLLEKEHGPLYSCHRLDMDTSGLMVFAKTPEDQADIQAQFAARTVRKTYRARLLPPLSSPTRNLSPGAHGWIDLPIGQDWLDRPRQTVDPEKGKHAVTEYEILRLLPDGGLEVRFIPHTGRTHQLRIHAAHPDGLGRPIAGDRLYGGHTPDFTRDLTAKPTTASPESNPADLALKHTSASSVSKPAHPAPKQTLASPESNPVSPETDTPDTGPLQLRADSLSFRHPRTGETLNFLLDTPM